MKKNKILLVTHNLSIEGAPISLFRIAKILKNEGFYVEVNSLHDGELKKQYEEAEIPVNVILDNVQKFREEIVQYAKNFNLVICNTVVTYNFVKILEGAVPLIWYLREVRVDDFIAMHNDAEEILKSAQNIYSVSEYAAQYISKTYNENVTVLHNCVEDWYSEPEVQKINKEKKPLKIAIIGTLQKRKAADVLINAYMKLSEEYKKQLEIYIIGECSKGSKTFWQPLKKITKNEPGICWCGVVTGEKKKKLFKDIDVFAVPSLEESCSLIVLEACMLAKPVLISEDVGAKYMVDTENGWIVKTGNADSLKRALEDIIKRKDELTQMGRISRKKYLESSTIAMYRENIIDMVLKNMSKEVIDSGIDTPYFSNYKNICRKESIFSKLFSLRNTGARVLITFLGIKFSFKTGC